MPNQDTQLDPQAVMMAQAIRQVESGGNPTAKGKSGEYGAYQFLPSTWDAYSKEAGVNVPLQQATLQQQNEVAYKKIKQWKDQGLNVGQVASSWNAGPGKPNAYLENNVGTNSQGVSYDTPGYAKKVATAYQQLKTKGNKAPTTQNNLTPADQQSAQDTGASFPVSTNELRSGNVAGTTLKAIGNLPSSFLHLAGGLLGAAIHPIKTVEGIGSAIIGGVENLTGQNKGNPDGNQQTANAVGQAFMNRYGSLENAARSATNDPAGVGADILSILYGGAAAIDKVAGTTGADIAATAARQGLDNFAQTGLNVMPKVGEGLASGILNKGLQSVATPVANGIKAVASAPFKLAGQTLGLQTGTKGDVISQAFNASAQGGEANQAFLDNLRGKVSPDELVQSAHNALDEVVSQRSSAYQDMLKSIKADPSTYDISPVIDEIKTQLKNFNVGVGTDGTLDFSRSKLRFNTTAQNDIQKIVDTMKDYGTRTGDRTAAGIDTLKQAFGELDKPSSSVRAFTTAVTKKTRSILDNTPGYTPAMKAYGDMTDNIDTIRKSLSLGETAAAETTFKKLTSALRNNDFRKAVLQNLDAATGGQLTSGVAGQQLSTLMPRGLAPYVEGGLAGVTGLIAGASGIMPILAMMITSSPRLVGEFLHALGVGARGVNIIMGLLNKTATPSAAVGASVLNRAVPSPSSFQPQQTTTNIAQ